MEDVLGVDVAEGHGQLAEPVHDLLLGELLSVLGLLDLPLQVPVLGVLGYYAEVLLIDKRFVILNDVLVVQIRQDFYFVVDHPLRLVRAILTKATLLALAGTLPCRIEHYLLVSQFLVICFFDDG